MVDEINSMVSTINNHLKQTLRYFWPAANAFPSEKIITTEIIKYFHDNIYNIYPECNIKSGTAGRESRDLLIINSKDKWVIQFEVKHLYQYDKALLDLERVYRLKPLNEFFERINPDHEINEFTKYGLFVGFGNNNDDKWWLSPTSPENKKIAEEHLGGYITKENYELLSSYYNKHNSKCGHFKKNESNDFWLVYYFVECSDS
jgi:hypothetical protein